MQYIADYEAILVFSSRITHVLLSFQVYVAVDRNEHSVTAGTMVLTIVPFGKWKPRRRVDSDDIRATRPGAICPRRCISMMVATV